MSVAVAAVVPLLIVMALGFAAAGVRRVAAAEAGLNTFVLWIALPAFLFAAIARAPMEDGVPPWFVPVVGGVPAACFAVSWAVSTLLRAQGGDARPLALSASFGNVGYLGVPVVISLLGTDAGLAVGLGQLLHNLFFMVGYPVIAQLGSRGASEDTRAGQRARTAFAPVLLGILRKAVLFNPVALSVAAGVLVGLAPFGMPPIVDAVVDLLAAAAVPAALFAVGLALRPAVRGIRSGEVPVLPVVGAAVVKMLVLPALTIGLLAALGAGYTDVWAGAAILLAAMPTSATAYLLASEHDRAGELSAAVVFVSSMAAVLVIPAVALLTV